MALQAGTETGTLADAEYMHTLLRAQPLWNHLVSVIHNPDCLKPEGPAEFSQDDLFEEIMRLISVCTTYTSKLAYNRQGWGDTSVSEDFMKVLVRAQIFDAMEHIMLSRGEKDIAVPGG